MVAEDTPVAAFAGERLTGAAGGGVTVVNDHVVEAVEPFAFVATTFQ